MQHCLKCLTFCRCGRRIAYSGRGRPRLQCERCDELRPDRRVCPCGTPLRRQRVYCSVRCAREGRRVRNGAIPRDGWKQHIITALEQDRLDCAAAVAVGVWQASRMDGGLRVCGTAIVYTVKRVRFEARQTSLDFADATDLPEWVPVDSHTRLDAMQMLRPELVGYALTNAKRDAVAIVPATPDQTVRWKARRCFVPRLADYDLELSAPAETIRVLSLRREAAVAPAADSAPITVPRLRTPEHGRR